MKLLKIIPLSLVILTGTVFTLTAQVNKMQTGVEKKPADPAEKIFQAKVKENARLYRSRFLADSSEYANSRKHVLDSLRSAGVTITEKIRSAVMQESISTPLNNSARRLPSLQPMNLTGPLNLGFEYDLTDWSGVISYNLKKVTGNDWLQSQSGLNFDNTNLILAGTTPTRSVIDRHPWATGDTFSSSLDGQPGLVNQPPRHFIISDQTLYDPYGGFKVLPPFVGSKVARIGNETVGYFGDTGPGTINPSTYEQEKMTYTFPVDNTKPYMIINYAVVLGDPSVSNDPTVNKHSGLNRTYFKITLQRADNSYVDCATYDVYANNTTQSYVPGFLVSDAKWTYQDPANNLKSILYKPWSQSIIDLSAIPNGEQVTVTFATGDCLSGGHFAYAYVDAYTTNIAINAKSQGVDKSTFCVGEVINFGSPATGRFTGETYTWDFGNGSPVSHTQSPSYAYAATGVYNVLLTVGDPAHSATCQVPITRQITIIQGIDATFTLSKQYPSPGQSITLTVGSYTAGSTNTIDWGDGTSNAVTAAIATHTWAKPGTYTITNTATKPGGCTDVQSLTVDVTYLCSAELPSAKNGTFLIDKITGNIVYSRSGCAISSVMPCVLGPATALSKVVHADATVFSDNWPYKTWFTDNTGTTFAVKADAFETGERGKFRTKSTYAHNTSLIAEDKNFKAGTFTLLGFNWKNPASNNTTKWLLGSQTTAYTPHGDAVSEVNILNIESASRFGYRNAVPYLTAKNAGYSNVLFESFETIYNGTMLEGKMNLPASGSLDDIRLSNQASAHSGYCSWKLASGGSMDVSDFKLSAAQMTKGLTVKVWIKITNPASYTTLTGSGQTIFYVNIRNQSIASVPFAVVARTGEWILCEAKLTSFGTVQAGKPFTLTVRYDVAEPIWIDDIRVQPYEAEMNCYVYDGKTLRLMATFDDQHFGVYYQYTPEGKLVRKMRETERGIKTVQETQYNTKLQ